MESGRAVQASVTDRDHNRANGDTSDASVWSNTTALTQMWGCRWQPHMDVLCFLLG
jgi:hypothetical protein